MEEPLGRTSATFNPIEPRSRPTSHRSTSVRLCWGSPLMASKPSREQKTAELHGVRYLSTTESRALSSLTQKTAGQLETTTHIAFRFRPFADRVNTTMGSGPIIT
jgi:hypothetical protein